MMLLSMINFAAIGITWMSGGLVRVLGERWTNNDSQGFRDAFVVGKYIFFSYAVLVSVSVLVGWHVAYNINIIDVSS